MLGHMNFIEPTVPAAQSAPSMEKRAYVNDEVDRLIEEMREQLNLQRKEIANLKRQLAAQPQPHNAALVSVMASLVAAISLLEPVDQKPLRRPTRSSTSC